MSDRSGAAPPPAPHQRASEQPGGRGRFLRQSRLLKHADFDRVYRSGKRHFAGRMTFFYLPRGGEQAAAASEARIGLTVGRAMGGAVVRNRLKRRMREAVRFSLPEIAAPVDVVINPKRSAITAEFSELRAEVQQGFRAIALKLRTSAGPAVSARRAERSQQ